MQINLSLLAFLNDDEHFLDSDNLVLPTSVDRSVFIPLLISETAELELLYSDPEIMAYVMHAWSTARYPAWGRMITALTEEYNPLHNYDRTEQETGTEGGTETYTHTGTDTMAQGGANTEQVTGFNQAGWADKSKTILGATNTETRNLTDGRTRNLTNGRNLHAYGNIGVTTSQEMARAEIELRKLDIYEIIVREFIKRFCIGVY